MAERGEKNMEEFTTGVRTQFQAPLEPEQLLEMSLKLQEEYRESLQSSNISMLPSVHFQLPTSKERGNVLALDVGGSTLRIALIRLGGEDQNEAGLHVRRLRCFTIDKKIRDLKGEDFFDWMAHRIEEMLVEDSHLNGPISAPLPIGLAWSFPIAQASPRSGHLLPMGKGFCATEGVEGRDLGELITQSCSKKGRKIEVRAIVNDGAATLLSKAYKDPSARISLILGTGMNAAVFLPISAVGKSKLSPLSDTWCAKASHVLVNTEMSMFGKNIFPKTKWDEDLNMNHVLPDFQPLEYLIAGRYLGEIARLILVEAITTVGMFDGRMPERLNEPYTFDTIVLSGFASDLSLSLAVTSAAFLQAHPLPSEPSLSDLEFLRELASLISTRAAVFLVVALHALWSLWTVTEGLEPGEATKITVACNGAVIEKYPGFRMCCQSQLDDLCVMSGASPGAIVLEMAPESSLFGAAVAACCSDDI